MLQKFLADPRNMLKDQKDKDIALYGRRTWDADISPKQHFTVKLSSMALIRLG